MCMQYHTSFAIVFPVKRVILHHAVPCDEYIQLLLLSIYTLQPQLTYETESDGEKETIIQSDKEEKIPLVSANDANKGKVIHTCMHACSYSYQV